MSHVTEGEEDRAALSMHLKPSAISLLCISFDFFLYSFIRILSFFRVWTRVFGERGRAAEEV